MTLLQELELAVNSIPTVPDTKRYWMVRTKAGTLHETFREHGIISLEHDEIPLFLMNGFRKEFGDDLFRIQGAIRNEVRKVHESRLPTGSKEEVNKRKVGLVSSQIYKFAFEIREGDTVVIPSFNSNTVSFGVVTEDYLATLTPSEEKDYGKSSILRKRVKWVKDIKRADLDPFLYKMFSAHQAITNVSDYAEVIERSIKDLFVIDDEAHVIINVESEQEIHAVDLFGLGYEILKLVDEFAAYYNLDISSKDLQVAINLNSPGKIDLKSKIKSSTLVTGLILAVFGGGYEGRDGISFKSPGLPGLVKAVDQFLTHNQERGMKQQMFDKYKDSLQVKNPDDMVKLLRQVSDNKDLAK